MKVGNMNNNMETKTYTVSGTGYNPKFQLTSGSYCASIYQENSAVKNTTAELIKNKTIPVNNEIKNKNV